MLSKSLSGFVLLLFTASAIFIGCQKDLEPILIDRPVQPEVIRQIAVRTIATDGASLENYQISLQGPRNIDTVVSGNDIFFNRMLKGEYIISVSKEGYIPSTRRLYFRGSDDEKENVYNGINFRLNRRLSSSPIDHEKGGTIFIPAASSLFDGDIEVVVPPGAIEGSGVTDITITPAYVDISVAQNEWVEMVHSISLVCEPSGLVFKKPLQIKIPLDNGIAFEDQKVEFVLFSEHPETGELQPSKDPSDRVVAEVDPIEGYALAEIQHFSVWGWTNFGPGNSQQHSWRWRDTEGDPTGPLLYTAWDCIDQSGSPGATVTGTYTAIPTTIPSDPNNSPIVNRYCSEPPPQPCVVNITDNYSYTPGPTQYAFVEARNRFIWVDIASEINGGGTIQTFQQAYDIANAIEFRFTEGENPSTSCP